MENVSIFRKKGVNFVPIKIGVLFSLKIREKGSFFKLGNADMSSLSETSAGTGGLFNSG